MKQELRTPKDLYLEYLELYKKAPSLNDFEDLEDETWNVFKTKKGFPVKYVDTKEFRRELPMDTSLVGEGAFYHRNKDFYLIPNEIGNTVISFVLRGISHDYIDYSGFSSYKPLFGIYTFNNFKKNTPIVLTEGAKDAIVLQKSYKYSLALLGSGVTKTNLDILGALTNKVILAYDNDAVGIKQTQRDIKLLKEHNFLVSTLRCPRKDFGQCIDLDFSSSIQDIIDSLPQYYIRNNFKC